VRAGGRRPLIATPLAKRQAVIHRLSPHRCVRPAAFAAGLLLLDASTARADGIDIMWLMTRVGGWRVNPAWAATMLFGLMLVNYLLNVLVIGIPSARGSALKLTVISRDLVLFTIIAQVADRLCAIAGLALGFLITSLVGISGEAALGIGFLSGIGLNFVLSGLAVALLAFLYLRRRWAVTIPLAKSIALRAGLITNPAWVMALWFVQQ